MRGRAVAGVLALVLGVTPGASAQHGGALAAHPPLAHHPAHTPTPPPVYPSPSSGDGAEAGTPGTPRTAGEGHDPCAEALHAAEFDDVAGAEEAWVSCRAAVAPAGAVPPPEALRTLEDVAEALHGMRRADGNFCVAPAAPFDLALAMDGAPGDSRGCLEALDRFLRDDEAVLRFLVADPYSAGRLVSRGAVGAAVMRAARGPRRRASLAPPGSAAEREEVALARLVGRQFMRVCRCLPGPQPESVTAVRAMHLPQAVEATLLRGLAERGDEGGGPR